MNEEREAEIMGISAPAGIPNVVWDKMSFKARYATLQDFGMIQRRIMREVDTEITEGATTYKVALNGDKFAIVEEVTNGISIKKPSVWLSKSAVMQIIAKME